MYPNEIHDHLEPECHVILTLCEARLDSCYYTHLP